MVLPQWSKSAILSGITATCPENKEQWTQGRKDAVASQLIRGHQTMGSFSPAAPQTYTGTHIALNTEAPCPGSSCRSCRTIFASYYFITSPFLLPLRSPQLPIYSATLFPFFCRTHLCVSVCVCAVVRLRHHHCHLYLTLYDNQG